MFICVSLSKLKNSRDCAGNSWESGVASLLARLQQEQGEASFCTLLLLDHVLGCWALCRQVWKRLQSPPTPYILRSLTITEKELTEQSPCLHSFTTGCFPLGWEGGGKQEEAAAGQALNSEGAFVSKGNNSVATEKCICESVCLSASEMGMS